MILEKKKKRQNKRSEYGTIEQKSNIWPGQRIIWDQTNWGYESSTLGIRRFGTGVRQAGSETRVPRFDSPAYLALFPWQGCQTNCASALPSVTWKREHLLHTVVVRTPER